MIECTMIVKRECPFSNRCGLTAVADDSECADYIREVYSSALLPPPGEIDAVEAEYLRQERQAIQEEVTYGEH